MKEATRIRWPRGTRCPHCDEFDFFVRVRKRKRSKIEIMHCNPCRKDFTLVTGTKIADVSAVGSRMKMALLVAAFGRAGLPSRRNLISSVSIRSADLRPMITLMESAKAQVLQIKTKSRRQKNIERQRFEKALQKCVARPLSLPMSPLPGDFLLFDRRLGQGAYLLGIQRLSTARPVIWSRAITRVTHGTAKSFLNECVEISAGPNIYLHPSSTTWPRAALSRRCLRRLVPPGLSLLPSDSFAQRVKANYERMAAPPEDSVWELAEDIMGFLLRP